MEKNESPARKIKFLLATNSMTVQSFAEKIGITLECLRDILDDREAPTPHLLRRVCEVFSLQDNFFGPAYDPENEDLDFGEADVPDMMTSLVQGKAHAAAGSKPGAEKGTMAQRLADIRRKPGPSSRGPLRHRHHRKIDMAELAARQRAILDLLISKKVLTQQEFETRLEILRAKILERKNTIREGRSGR